MKGTFRSFTLTEVIISLAISAVLISLVVKLFTFFSETQKINNKKMNVYESIINTEHLLSVLMSESDSVHYNNYQLFFYFNNHNVKYLSFYDSLMIYIDSDYSDTIHIYTGEKKAEFHPSAPLLLQSISFPAFCSGQVFPLKIVKEYEGAIIVNSQMIKDED